MANKRTQERIRNNLGIISGKDVKGRIKTTRSKKLDTLQAYYLGTQNDKKRDWNEAEQQEEYVSIHERKPPINYTLPQILVNRIKAKLLGKDVFPNFTIEEDPDTQQLIHSIQHATNFPGQIMHGSGDMLVNGSGFVRFKLVNGRMVIETFNSNHCYPFFDKAGELEKVEIRYVYDDEEDIDPQTDKPKKKWYKQELTKTRDILYDNPEYRAGISPVFSVEETFSHGLGFVQGEWLKLTVDENAIDGVSFVAALLGVTDCLSYSISMTDAAAKYGVDPQTIFSGVDDKNLDGLVKSKEKAWVLGQEGTAQFLESSGSGIQSAHEAQDKLLLRAQEMSRVIMHDPEKVVGQAQSGKAMAILMEPMVEFIGELRPFFEHFMIRFSIKMLAAVVILSRKKMLTDFEMPPNFAVKSFALTATWGEIFPMTPQDLQAKTNVWIQLTNANIVSRETALLKLAEDLGIDPQDIPNEIARVETQKEFNTFGF